jgi:hypothetical protein
MTHKTLARAATTVTVLLAAAVARAEPPTPSASAPSAPTAAGAPVLPPPPAALALPAPAAAPAPVSSWPLPPPPAPTPAEPLNATEPPSAEPTSFAASLYGFVEFDMMRDSTQSFSEAIVNNTMARPSTGAGDNPRTQFTARNSRLGFKLAAPDAGPVKTSAQVEMDFFGNQPTPSSDDAVVTSAAVRMRHYFVKFETPVVDVLAGQYHDLFGWGGAGFYPNTVAFLGVPGEIYHRDPQLRVSKTFEGRAVTLDLAGAAVKPAQRDAEIPDFQGGVRLAWNGWKGVSAQGASSAKAAPLAIGLSGLTRHFRVPAFSQMQANPREKNGWGAAVNVFVPLIPARSAEDLSNALSLTGEATMGAGIANLYTGLTAGVLFPSLPNPLMLLPVPSFNPDVDQGLVTYDAAGNLHTLNWKAIVLGLQYHLPFGMGRRLWASVLVSRIQSNNAAALTPIQGLPAIFTKAEYVDGNLFFAPTPTAQIGASVQTERQTFGDGLRGQNVRGQLAVYYFF